MRGIKYLLIVILVLSATNAWGDPSTVTIANILCESNSLIDLCYTQALKHDGSETTLGNYSIGSNHPSSITQLTDPLCFQLTFAGLTAKTPVTINVNNVLDASGNTITDSANFYVGIMTIQEVRAAGFSTDAFFTISGTVTSVKKIAANESTIQDSSNYGITFVDDLDPTNLTYAQDNVLQISGKKFTTTNGLDEVVSTKWLDPTTGTPVIAVPLTIVDYSNSSTAERYESMLVQLTDNIHRTGGDPWPTTSSSPSASIIVTDESGTHSTTLYISADTDIRGTAEPKYPINIVGIANQDTGYQIIPRSRNDISCVAGKTDKCGTDQKTICDTDLATDAKHCGTCTKFCNTTNNVVTPNCISGVCTPDCVDGYADCDKSNTINDGCETDITTAANCGSCTNTCSFYKAIPVCEAHACKFYSCNDNDYRDCNTKQSDGCEVNIKTDKNNCGGCGINFVCVELNGTNTCSGGTCKPSCNTGYANCGDPTGGCETTLGTIDNCDGCGNSGKKCVSPFGTPTCTNGQCELNCNSGYWNCSKDLHDGCDTAISSSAQCGKGCLVCAGATPSCLYDNKVGDYTCQPSRCINPDQDHDTFDSVACGGTDCDDDNANIYPGAEEICDGVDNNCDGQIDEGLGTTTCGIGACKVTVNNCEGGKPVACVPKTPPEKKEVTCNDGIDNDCNGYTDMEDLNCKGGGGGSSGCGCSAGAGSDPAATGMFFVLLGFLGFLRRRH